MSAPISSQSSNLISVIGRTSYRDGDRGDAERGDTEHDRAYASATWRQDERVMDRGDGDRDRGETRDE
jgi:hypothetical protein